MANHGDFSAEARERAHRTVLVADIFAANAEIIVAALPEVPAGHVLIAVVAPSHEFSGTHQVEQTALVERVPELEDGGGWAMVFSPGSSVDDVRRRTNEMASLAAQRAAAIDRILARRGDSS
jgi:pyruvoyl-dependent arginine decarboxylase (PvlArgDC)